MFWIGFNQHTAAPITKEVGRTERELQLWSHGEEEREELHGSFHLCFRLLSIVILLWMHRSPTQRNSARVAPKNRPSGLLPGIRLPLPLHLPLQGVWGSSYSRIKTQLNYLLSQKPFLVQPQREQITLFTAVPQNPLRKQFRHKIHSCWSSTKSQALIKTY